VIRLVVMMYVRYPLNGAQSWPDPHLEFRLAAPNGCSVQSVPILSDKAPDLP